MKKIENSKQLNLLVLDDEVLLNEFIQLTFTRLNYKVYAATTIREATELLKKNKFDILITDLRLPDGSGIDFLKDTLLNHPEMVAILITAFGKIDTAVEAMRFGATDFLTKPFSAEQITAAVERGLIKKQRKINDNKLAENKCQPHLNIIGNSPKLREIIEIMDKIVNNDATVLITGESGTGKELAARYIHYNSNRSAYPFVSVNCNAIPETLLESELFGHIRGSFTNALSDKIGLFEAANKGTIFLDEIGDISQAMQAKLLRVIEEKKILRIGDVTPREIDVRIITATNKKLELEKDAGRFRADLFYRLNLIRIELPTLIERGDDIKILADYFIKSAAKQFNKNVNGLTAEALDAIMTYHWPGNIRELENAIKRAVILSENQLLTVKDIFGNFGNTISKENKYTAKPEVENISDDSEINFPVDLNELVDSLEKRYIKAALKKANYSQSNAAQLLKINRTTLIAKMKKHNIFSADDEKKI